MKRALIITAALLFVVLAIVLGFWLLRPDVENSGATSDPSFPSASSTEPGSVQQTLTIDSHSDEPLTVNDFIHNGITEEDTANPGNYYLAGRDALCQLEGDCYSGAPADTFTIVYFSNEQAFAIALTEEPLGDARLNAEQFLMTTLGIPQSSMCALDYFLTTDEQTNAQYAGIDLGFSFCPGATILP